MNKLQRRLIISTLIFLLGSCGQKQTSLPSAETLHRKRVEAAKRYDRAHDAAMEEATHGTIPQPKPAGSLK